MLFILCSVQVSVGSLSSDSSSELHIFWHDGDSLGVDGTEVGVLEESDHVGLGSFLKSKDGRGLESQVGLEIVGNFSDESLEWELSNEEISGFLEFSDFSKSDGTWSESVCSLDTTAWGWTLSLGGELLSWSFGSDGLSGGLLGSSHLIYFYF